MAMPTPVFMSGKKTKKKSKMILQPKKLSEQLTYNLVCIHDLTLGVTWAGSHQTKLLLLGV